MVYTPLMMCWIGPHRATRLVAENRDGKASFFCLSYEAACSLNENFGEENLFGPGYRKQNSKTEIYGLWRFHTLGSCSLRLVPSDGSSCCGYRLDIPVDISVTAFGPTFGPLIPDALYKVRLGFAGD
ncbi:hypothetical protein PAPYR_508 [Paratrimastix pyriformis]|uniref:Uncharacterized protein n=1 Tax=Paratrimastix pyriformis TaxID=342808 RepID=A0ABQ8UTS4_9EUKA|nr:hypothetical protein PAPYR_508 [Paratrimastix pyriformis]